MKQFIISIIICSVCSVSLYAQDDVYPAPAQQKDILIKNGTIFTATGAVIANGSILLRAGKIAALGSDVAAPGDADIIDARGKHIYPGLILAHTDLGINEIGSGVRGSNDYFELGEYNPTVKSIVAYNTDSKIINTLKANGILLACVAPQGRLLTGTSTVVQLDAWTWQDAAYKTDNGMHLVVPALMRSPRRSSRQASDTDPVKAGIETVEAVEQFLSQAQAYMQQDHKTGVNLKLEAMRPLFEKKQKLFVHADRVRQILVAIDFAKKFDIDVVLVGGAESYQVADLLKQNNIPVILNSLHNLPTMQDDDIDQPFKTPAALQKAGVLFALNDDERHARYRNLDFNAGTAVAYGLTKAEALAAITLNPAKILGIDQQTGSLEVGKDANIIICDGDILDMRSSNVTDAFIQGRKVNLENKQTQLYQRYQHRYGLN
ncbi:amidohydrolase family protein [Niabella insulamsoli]|uniref:amidohydrolase family protein n=1 Tax=Niabella insulamsoli TaxID=3144874 RepID=UPI0031FCEF2D